MPNKSIQYHIVMTFPVVLFPREDGLEDAWRERMEALGSSWLTANCKKCLARHEMGEYNTNYHWDIIAELKKPDQAGHVKTKFLSHLGISQSQQANLDPSLKRHLIKVTKITYIPGVIAYNIKEGHDPFEQFGYEDTWIREQAAEGVRRAEIKRSREQIFINDANFYEVVTEWVTENDCPERKITWILSKMMTEGYNFCRLKDKRHAIVFYEARKWENVQLAETYWEQFCPMMNSDQLTGL